LNQLSKDEITYRKRPSYRPGRIIEGGRVSAWMKQGDPVPERCEVFDATNLAKKDAIVLHPGPMNRGIEIASEVADSSRSLILDQVKYGVAVRIAVLYLATGGGVVQSGSN
jgi:hypothetical protein